MIEMPVQITENLAVNSGDTKVPAKSKHAEGSTSKGDFSRHLQRFKQKNDKGGDSQSNSDNELECAQNKAAALRIIAMPADYINPTLMLPSESEASKDSQKLMNIAPASSLEVLPELEEVPAGTVAGNVSEAVADVVIDVVAEIEEYSIESVQQDPQSSTVESASGLGIFTGGLVSPENLSSAVSKTEVDENMQKVQLTGPADMQPISDHKEDADSAEKSTGSKNIISHHKTNLAKADGETGADKSKIINEATDTKARSDQSDVKKLIDFEAHRMKANKLPPTVEADNQETGTDSQAMNDKAQVADIKMVKTEVHFQDRIRSPINPKEVIEQIVDKVEIIQGKKMSELTLELKPDFLGKMTIKLAMEEGGLTARFITDNLQVKNLLESNLNALKQTLESHGIKVEKTEVNVQLNNGGMFDGSEGNQQDRWQNQAYSNRSWHYVEEIPYEDELTDNLEASLLNYADTGLNDEIGMNFIV